MLHSVYKSLYDLLSNAVFAGSPAMATFGEFFCEGIAIIACAVLVALPFIVVWRIIRRFL